MLSRVADSLYWMARYIERAGNIARLVNANAEMVLETAAARENDPAAYWRPLLEVTSLMEVYQDFADEDEELDVPEFLVLDPRNPESIRSCISSARENARMVRDQISEEMWLELNTLHLLNSRGEEEWRRSRGEFCDRIIRFSLLFQGLTDATVPHGEGWHFIQAGIHLERADKTSRILEIPNRHTRIPSTAPWGAVLGSCSAGPAYREIHGGEVDQHRVVGLLIFSDTFPRSVRFCIRRLDETLHAISGTPRGQYSNEAERLTGSLMASLDFAGPGEVADMGLKNYVDRLQKRFNEIGQEVFETYVLLPSEIQALNIEPLRFHAYEQQMSQQQQ